MWDKDGPLESDTLEWEHQLACTRAVRPWASHSLSLGISFLPCKTGIAMVTISWVAVVIVGEIVWCLCREVLSASEQQGLLFTHFIDEETEAWRSSGTLTQHFAP